MDIPVDVLARLREKVLGRRTADGCRRREKHALVFCQNRENNSNFRRRKPRPVGFPPRT